MTLIERLEAATGPDRELDAAIALALSLYPHTTDLGCYEDPAMVGEGGVSWTPPAFTASIDAALTLVPPDCGVNLYIAKGGAGAEVCNPFGQRAGNAATPALAICIAALKARGEHNA